MPDEREEIIQELEELRAKLRAIDRAQCDTTSCLGDFFGLPSTSTATDFMLTDEWWAGLDA